jgi:hypothetical protein
VFGSHVLGSSQCQWSHSAQPRSLVHPMAPPQSLPSPTWPHRAVAACVVVRVHRVRRRGLSTGHRHGWVVTVTVTPPPLTDGVGEGGKSSRSRTALIPSLHRPETRRHSLLTAASLSVIDLAIGCHDGSTASNREPVYHTSSVGNVIVWGSKVHCDAISIEYHDM